MVDDARSDVTIGPMAKLPKGAIEKDGRVYNMDGKLIEFVDGKWMLVRNGDRLGWWRYHDHYDRDGYCDNPGRGY